MEFKQYRRKGIAEMRPYVKGEDLTGIIVIDPDKSFDDEQAEIETEAVKV